MNQGTTAPRGWSLEATPVELTEREAAAFTDRVMAVIALAPPPTPTRTFVSALRVGAVGDAVAALSVAWHLGTVRRWDVAPRVRARSFALVLAVASVLATGSLAAAAAVRVVAPQIEPAPVTDPGGSGADEPGLVITEETQTVEPRQTHEAFDGPSPVDEPGGSDEVDRDPVGGGRSDGADEDGGSKGGQESDESDNSDESHPDEDAGSSGGDKSHPDEDAGSSGGDKSQPDEGGGSSGGGGSDPDADGGSSGGSESVGPDEVDEGSGD